MTLPQLQKKKKKKKKKEKKKKKKKKIPHTPRSIARELIPCTRFEPTRVKPN